MVALLVFVASFASGFLSGFWLGSYVPTPSPPPTAVMVPLGKALRLVALLEKSADRELKGIGAEIKELL